MWPATSLMKSYLFVICAVQKKEMSDKEKEELARREAAKARVASRTNSTFGFGQ
jgi:hypothetical protein